MKLLPKLTIFDNVFDNMFNNLIFKSSSNYMRTDIKEVNNKYVLNMELPGYSKEDITIKLNDGYLTIMGKKLSSTDEKDSSGNIIRQERYFGSCNRGFYIGDGIKQEDIKACYNHGELKIIIPKRS